MILIAVISVITLGYHTASIVVSFLPKNKEHINIPNNFIGKQFELRTPSYILLVSQNGEVTITTSNGEVIISDLLYYGDFKGEKEQWGLNNIFVGYFNDSTIEIKGNGPANEFVSILLETHNYLPKLDVQIKTRYNVNTLVSREALVIAFGVPLSEVYLKNRKVDTKKL